MKTNYLIIGIAALGLIACDNEPKKENNSTEMVENESEEVKETSEKGMEVMMEKNGIKLYSVPSEKDFKSASLDLKDPIGEKLTATPTNFDFIVRDYQLQEQTGGERSETLANSEKGQHIHFIHNNAPYQAKYEPSFDAELMEGNNVILAFLSKSYHESVKQENAFFFKNFFVGDGENTFDESAQHLFYSRPKGEYKAEKAKKLLFDFYLINTKLSENGNQVKLTIDNTEFMIPEWQAYFVEGLTSRKTYF